MGPHSTARGQASNLTSVSSMNICFPAHTAATRSSGLNLKHSTFPRRVPTTTPRGVSPRQSVSVSVSLSTDSTTSAQLHNKPQGGSDLVALSSNTTCRVTMGLDVTLAPCEYEKHQCEQFFWKYMECRDHPSQNDLVSSQIMGLWEGCMCTHNGGHTKSFTVPILPPP